MRQLRSYRMLGSAAVVGAALIALGACSKKADDTTIQSGGNVATAAFQVADIQLGRSVGADKRVASATDTFAPADTIYASVHTTGTAQNTTVAAHWTYQDGQTVNDQTETISPTGDAYTEFHISKPSGWPAGKYTLHVTVNGKEVQTKDFTVNK